MILQEVVTLLQSLPPGAAGIEQVEAVVARWSQRWPSVQQPTADACLTVIHVRGLLLDALMQEWPRDQQHQGQTVYQVCAHRWQLKLNTLPLMQSSCGNTKLRHFPTSSSETDYSGLGD